MFACFCSFRNLASNSNNNIKLLTGLFFCPTGRKRKNTKRL
nr:MAG TPA: hypothetical protein [Caudoviricetes sp.]